MLIYVFLKNIMSQELCHVLTHWQKSIASGEWLCVTYSHVLVVWSDIPNLIGWKPIMKSNISVVQGPITWQQLCSVTMTMVAQGPTNLC